MPTTYPIPSSGGLIPGNVLTTIYYSAGTGVISKIRNIKFAPNDLTTAYSIKFYISFDSGATDILLWYKTLSGGDSSDDSNIYFLSDQMRLKVLVDQDALVSYSITGEIIEP